ncbi:MAG TPA: hypothetical protein VD998_00135 [Verrucomicrobiae bacterium]|nr:hypothetical protein [Verrucomicrobiae bacterium]
MRGFVFKRESKEDPVEDDASAVNFEVIETMCAAYVHVDLRMMLPGKVDWSNNGQAVIKYPAENFRACDGTCAGRDGYRIELPDEVAQQLASMAGRGTVVL